MPEPLAAVLYAIVFWYFSTGIILLLTGRLRSHQGLVMWVGTGVLGLALAGLWLTRNDLSVTAVYIAFSCGVLAWGWQELGFYLGYVTGPRKTGCRPGAPLGERFHKALMVSLHHELAIATVGLVIFAIAWASANPFGAYAYLLVWVMQRSAKINVLLGVQNMSAELLPDRLAHLEGFMVKRPMNLLFPFSVTLGSIAAAWLFHLAMAPGATPGEAAGFFLLGTLLALAVLEHWFLMLPLPSFRLWSWSLPTEKSAASAPRAPGGSLGAEPPAAQAAQRQTTNGRDFAAATPLDIAHQGHTLVHADKMTSAAAGKKAPASSPCDPEALEAFSKAVAKERGVISRSARGEGVETSPEAQLTGKKTRAQSPKINGVHEGREWWHSRLKRRPEPLAIQSHPALSGLLK